MTMNVNVKLTVTSCNCVDKLCGNKCFIWKSQDEHRVLKVWKKYGKPIIHFQGREKVWNFQMGMERLRECTEFSAEFLIFNSFDDVSTQSRLYYSFCFSRFHIPSSCKEHGLPPLLTLEAAGQKRFIIHDHHEKTWFCHLHWIFYT